MTIFKRLCLGTTRVLHLAALVAAALIGPALAQPEANNPGGSGIAVATGTCSRLIAGADDLSDRCDGQMASVTLDDGTIMFVFTVEGFPFSFSGDGTKVGPVPDIGVSLPVNFIGIGHDGRQSQKALGQCLFNDPFSGVASVWCTAVTPGGPFLAEFKTDGSKPSVRE